MESKTYLQIAREHYEAWLKAELAVCDGQEYEIGSRKLTRASLADIRAQIKYWKGEVIKAEAAAAGAGRGRVYRAVPRDL